MTLRDKIEQTVRKYRNHHPKHSTDAILDVIREGVRPLVWDDCSYAQSEFGEYRVSFGTGGFDMMLNGRVVERGLAESGNEAGAKAKAAAQADYTRRILSALGIDQ